MIFLQFNVYTGRGSHSTHNFLVEGNFKTIPVDITSRAALVIDAVNQIDMFKSRSSLTVAQDLPALVKLVNELYS